MDKKRKLFKRISKIPNFPSLDPAIVSIGPVPFRPNPRRLFSYPDVFKEIVKQLAVRVKKSKVDRLVGGETAGIPLAAALSLETNIPFAYVKKEPKGGRTGGAVEGDFKVGERVALVEDLISNGKTKVLFVNRLKNEGLKVADIITIVYFKSLGFVPEFEKLLKEEKIDFHYLYTIKELTEYQIQQGIIPKELAPYILDYVNHPRDWQKKEKWQKYIEVLKKSNIEIPDFLNEYLK